MKYEKEQIDFNNKLLALHRWVPDKNDNKGIIQIIHGMAEHVSRYEEMADYFTEKGYIVCGIDHLGHGDTANLNNNKYGYFAQIKGWAKVVNANKYISNYLKDKYSDIPLIVFGHSMGSIIARYYLIGDRLTEGIIISGVMNYQPFVMDLVILMAKLEKFLKEDKSKNVIDNYLLEMMYNRKFNRDIKKSWLSSSQDVVQKYNKDERCGFDISNQMFIDMLEGLKTIDKKEKNREISRDAPLLIMSGKDDPVSNYGQDVKKMFKKYKKGNLVDVKYKIYSDVRHEIIRDQRNEEVYSDLEKWISEHL
ncbi:MAG: alpha/beta hydrolase [Halanaerobiales bacterium]|nr:alpha/beta hydrolase [Halanaerobiales bacterium]